MPSTAYILREIAQWIAWSRLQFDGSDQELREEMEDRNEGEGFTVEQGTRHGSVVRTEHVHLTPEELDQVWQQALTIPLDEVR
jgi:hypothetical protein